MVEKGKEVRFGPGEGGNYIRNIQTGDKVLMRPNGKGSYIFDAKFAGGREQKLRLIVGQRKVCVSFQLG